MRVDGGGLWVRGSNLLLLCQPPGTDIAPCSQLCLWSLNTTKCATSRLHSGWRWIGYNPFRIFSPPYTGLGNFVPRYCLITRTLFCTVPILPLELRPCDIIYNYTIVTRQANTVEMIFKGHWRTLALIDSLNTIYFPLLSVVCCNYT